MTVLDYTFERQIELEKKASFELGKERGMKQGIDQGMERGAENKIIDLIKKKLDRNMSPLEIASDLEESPDTITRLIEMNHLYS